MVRDIEKCEQKTKRDIEKKNTKSGGVRLNSRRLIHGRVAEKGTKSLPSLTQVTFEGEELKLKSGSHYFKSLDDAIDFFDYMVRSRPFYTAVDCNKVIGVFVRMNRPDVAISLYRKMEIRRIPLNIYSFNILIKCFCDCHKLSFSLSTFGKLTKLGFQPDVVTFNTLLHGLCLEDRISEALALFGYMVETGCQPDVVTFNTLMNGLCRDEFSKL